MLRLTLQGTASDKRRAVTLIVLVVVETLLVLTALIPTQEWLRVVPDAANTAIDGPFPPSVGVVIPALLYIIPSLVGLLSRNWQQALFYATLPAWIGLGLYLTAASFKIGIFDLVGADTVTANVSILELFAALGGMGWLARCLFFKPRS
jgi:hypothetical protein